MIKCGFLGAGNMGGALAKAAAGRCDILLSNRTYAKSQTLAAEIGGRACVNADIAAEADYIFLGVKPHMAGEVLQSVSGILKHRNPLPVLVSMLAGVTIGELSRMLPEGTPIIRIMPNIPAATGDGIIMYAASENADNAAVDGFLSLMSGAGELAALDEKLIDAGSALAGCGPAFTAMFIEALADGGVACGLRRPDALRLAEAMVSGTAAHMLKTGTHPGQMKDAVCSPGGTTIQGVRVLEECGLRKAAMNAVIAAYEAGRRK